MASFAVQEPSAARRRVDLFLISLLLLFLELACIRWFPAHVLYLTFFTNTVLLACFLGMSLGCLAVHHPRNYLAWTPYLLGLTMAAALVVDMLGSGLESYVDVGHQASPEIVFFGTEHRNVDFFRIPMEVLAGAFFLLIALTMVGPGQELGRALARVPQRVEAYTINILGSIVGIVLFAAASYLQLPPLWWYLAVVLGIAYFLFARPASEPKTSSWVAFVVLILVPIEANTVPGMLKPNAPFTIEQFWSPYYRIDYYGPPAMSINVNQIGHQNIEPRDRNYLAYALPHLLHRDSGGKDVKEILIIGAGSGNDVSRALQWGADDVHIDAVEIDPVIRKLGDRHPDQPYQDPRVTAHITDGRNFLRAGDKKYDLIIFALVDSLVLHSGYSNIRLESYLFTKQAFDDVKHRLKPDGRFVMYNFFRQGWIVARLKKGLEEAFGTGNSLVMMLGTPYLDHVTEDQALSSGSGYFTVFFAGDTEPLKRAFLPDGSAGKSRRYWLPTDQPPSRATPNGFRPDPATEDQRPEKWQPFGLATVEPSATPIRTATDDWPFLYLRQPMLPMQPTVSGMVVMGGLALVLIWLFLPRTETGRLFDGRMFFLGAGFMLVETKAVVHMALLFGSTWMVNTVVFFAVLVMILLGNLFVLKVRPTRLWPYYVGLFISLLLNAIVSLDAFLGLDPTVQVVGSCVLVMAPILFASVIFAVSFSRTVDADRAFGMNIAGAMLGGLAENTSMLLGFQYLVLVALGFYLLSMLSPIGTRSEAKLAS